MTNSMLEHVNLTVSDPLKTATMLCDIFGWQIRWQGEALNGGTTVHVGSETAYLAVYAPKTGLGPGMNSYNTPAGLNHVGIVVDDYEAVEARIRKAGFTPGKHSDYAPGRRFYFHDHDNVEYEVVNYD